MVGSGMVGLGMVGSGRVGWLDNLEIRLNSAQLSLAIFLSTVEMIQDHVFDYVHGLLKY